jgi:hypothetical protein
MSFINEQVSWNNSICIPTIYKSIRKEDIWAFLEKELGKVSRIDFVNLNTNCRRAFVYFSEWYTDKGFGEMIRYKIETCGYCDFLMPIPNKHRRWFQGKYLINKNPLSLSERKVNKIEKWMNVSFIRLHNLETTINDLKSKVSYLEDKLEEVSSNKNEDYVYDDEDTDEHKHTVNITELKQEPEPEKLNNKEKRIAQGAYNSRIQNMFYDNTRFGVDKRCGWDRW